MHNFHAHTMFASGKFHYFSIAYRKYSFLNRNLFEKNFKNSNSSFHISYPQSERLQLMNITFTSIFVKHIYFRNLNYMSSLESKICLSTLLKVHICNLRIRNFHFVVTILIEHIYYTNSSL